MSVQVRGAPVKPRQKLVKALHPGRVGTCGDGWERASGFQPYSVSSSPCHQICPNEKIHCPVEFVLASPNTMVTVEQGWPLETLVALGCSDMPVRKRTLHHDSFPYALFSACSSASGSLGHFGTMVFQTKLVALALRGDATSNGSNASHLQFGFQ